MKSLILAAALGAAATMSFAQNYVSVGLSAAMEKHEFNGRLPGSGRIVQFSLSGPQHGINVTFGRRDAVRIGARALDLELSLDAAPPTRLSSAGAARPWVQGLNTTSAAITRRLGIGLRADLGRAGNFDLSALGEMGVSHTRLAVAEGTATLTGSGTTGYGALSLRAAHRRSGLWADLRYVASPAITVQSGTSTLRHEISGLELRAGFTNSF